MKLHLGCGKRYMKGYTNIDAKNPVADIVTSELDKLPFDNVDEIMAIHLFEHLWPQEAEKYLSHWFQILRPGGRLILEMPDLYKTAKNIVEYIEKGEELNEQYTLWPIFGDNPDKNVYDCHKTGWTFRTLAPVFQRVGFIQVQERPLQFHGRRANRDFRIEAVKP